MARGGTSLDAVLKASNGTLLRSDASKLFGVGVGHILIKQLEARVSEPDEETSAYMGVYQQSGRSA